MNDQQPLLNARDLARRLGVSLAAIRKWRSEGRIPAVKLGTRCVRYRPDDVVKALVEANSETRQPDA